MVLRNGLLVEQDVLDAFMSQGTSPDIFSATVCREGGDARPQWPVSDCDSTCDRILSHEQWNPSHSHLKSSESCFFSLNVFTWFPLTEDAQHSFISYDEYSKWNLNSYNTFDRLWCINNNKKKLILHNKTSIVIKSTLCFRWRGCRKCDTSSSFLN